jgi:hypothetical protein
LLRKLSLKAHFKLSRTRVNYVQVVPNTQETSQITTTPLVARIFSDNREARQNALEVIEDGMWDWDLQTNEVTPPDS